MRRKTRNRSKPSNSRKITFLVFDIFFDLKDVILELFENCQTFIQYVPLSFWQFKSFEPSKTSFAKNVLERLRLVTVPHVTVNYAVNLVAYGATLINKITPMIEFRKVIMVSGSFSSFRFIIKHP